MSCEPAPFIRAVLVGVGCAKRGMGRGGHGQL
jgi:hypothetical protein